MRELKINPSKVIDGLRKDDVVVTRNGKPAAALVMLDEDLLEDFIIAHHPQLLSEAEAARKEYGDKGGIDHESMRALVERRRTRGRSGGRR